MKHAKRNWHQHFMSLPEQTRYALYSELLGLGLRIYSGQTTWRKHMTMRRTRTSGKLKQFYGILLGFTPQRVDHFFKALTNAMVLDKWNFLVRNFKETAFQRVEFLKDGEVQQVTSNVEAAELVAKHLKEDCFVINFKSEV